MLDAARIRAPLTRYLSASLELQPEDAGLTVDHLLRSEMAGKSSHGLIRIAYTTTSGKFGPYHHVLTPAPVAVGPGKLHVEKDGHFGYPLMHKLIEAGCDAAAQCGTCVVTTSHTYPTGALGDWARQAAKRGTGIILVAGSPRRVAPAGGTSPVIGTNAMCIGLPAEPLPFVADCATSEITHGALLHARANSVPLPPNSAVRADGKPTTVASEVDPTKGIGALLPFGGSYKAFAIGMGVELLACLGGGLPGDIRPNTHGVFCLFLGPSILGDRPAALSEWLAEQDRTGTRIPGWTSGRRAQAQQRRGLVEVSEGTFQALSALLPAEVLSTSPSRRGSRGDRRDASRGDRRDASRTG